MDGEIFLPVMIPAFISSDRGGMQKQDALEGDDMDSKRFCVASVILFTLLTLWAPVAKAGSFTATGSMAFARRRHTATLLANGKVLVTGGANATGTLTTAELYNPATGTFTRTGNMRIARAGHTATRLANGTVLITGGTNATGTPATAELYNPATGTFAPTGTMKTAG
jgi:hypothetical protein